MPKHSSAQKPQKKKPAATGGGVAKRSQVTGRQLGRAAIRALEKNAHCIDQFLTLIDEAKDKEDLIIIEEVNAFVVARVTKSEGAGMFEVLCRDGSTAKVHVAGTIAFHGRAGTKTDRDNCIIRDDIIIVSGGRASAKLSGAFAAHVKRVFDINELPYPKKFFARGSEEDSFNDDGYEFDRSDEEEEEKKAIQKLIARRKAAAAGGAAAAAAAEEDDDSSDDDDFDIDAI
jgi:hypothetical protein